MLNIWTQLSNVCVTHGLNCRFQHSSTHGLEIVLSKQYLTSRLVFSAIPKECVGHSSVSESARGRKGQTATESGSLCHPCKETTVLFCI